MRQKIVDEIKTELEKVLGPFKGILGIVPRLFEEKRRDIVFGIPSFLPSFRPSVPLI